MSASIQDYTHDSTRGFMVILKETIFGFFKRLVETVELLDFTGV